MTGLSNLGEHPRYNGFADWYLDWVGEAPGLICDPSSAMMASNLSGQRWLDLACGAGRASRELARRGASVVGVDVSEKLIAKAQAAERAEPIGLTYRVGDIACPEEWWDEEPFDGSVCEMALMDIDDLDGTVIAAAAVLKPGAQFVVSLVNPCFPGNATGLSSWPPERGYTSEGFWTSDDHNPDGVRIRVGSNHRRLSTYLNAFTRAGFLLEQAYEPLHPLPYWLVLAWQRR
ncbi:MAG: class I SAM-dependent methyltransferase [Acidimicrobiaceae bacterium]|nr:class I SAM-dependent methyltransferase [Acidimicrobiaceae bacterium]